MSWTHTRTASALALLAVAALVLACGDDPAPSRLIEVRAEILEADAPASVDVTSIAIEEGEDLTTASHGVVVVWGGDQPAVLGDPRFLPPADLLFEPGEPVTAGRACSVYWQEDEQHPSLFCTDDLVLTEVAPGEQHEYPLDLLLDARDATYTLASGSHAREEVIEWWQGTLDDWQATASRGPAPPPDGTFTIRLTYIVE